MKNKFYMVKWGETIRFSDKQPDANAAARYCYGMVSKDMKAVALPKSPKYLSRKEIEKLESNLK